MYLQPVGLESNIKLKVIGTKSYYKQHLPALFEKIELGKPVHFKRLLLGLAECGISPNEVEKVFEKKFIGKKRYRVSIKPESFQIYLSIRKQSSSSPVSERALAAAHGKSHSKSTSGTFCLMHTSKYPEIPFCIIIDNGVPRDVPVLKKQLLLIENFELFLTYDVILTFLKRECGNDVSLQEWDIVYSQGSGILNKQFLPVLMNYEKVVCLFDLDFGGLITFTTLRKRLNTNIEFSHPANIEAWLEKYGFEMPANEQEHLRKLLASENHQKKPKRLMELLLKTKRKLEQEVYLL